MAGRFIVFEGIDGSGKTTACGAVAERLRALGADVAVTAEPTGGPIGRLIREGGGFPPEAEALLFVADRACHTAEIAGWLGEGRTVLCDRYSASTLAYQAAAGADRAWLAEMDGRVSIAPDLTVLLDADPSDAMRRVGRRGAASRFERLEYLERVRAEYLSLAEAGGYAVVDASADPAQVLESVMDAVSKVLRCIHQRRYTARRATSSGGRPSSWG